MIRQSVAGGLLWLGWLLWARRKARLDALTQEHRAFRRLHKRPDPLRARHCPVDLGDSFLYRMFCIEFRPMTRPPRAKLRILQAARDIVASSGAGALTFDELAIVSGVTRGGITYHFPTKDALLRGLLDQDMAQWKSSEAELMPTDEACPQTCELLGFIRSHTIQDVDRQRFVAGMLSAAVHQPELLESCREEIRQRFADETWDEPSVRAYLLRMAALGMFWDEVFQFNHLPAEARAKLVALLEKLAREWVQAPA